MASERSSDVFPALSTGSGCEERDELSRLSPLTQLDSTDLEDEFSLSGNAVFFANLDKFKTENSSKISIER